MSSKNLGSIPVYQKALELREISKAIASYISMQRNVITRYQSMSLRDTIADSLVNDTVLIPEQIAQAEQSKSYAERLSSASFINIMIRNINSYCLGLEKDGVKDKEYLNLLRTEVKSFRKSFTKWRRTIRND
ncbi:MAG: hypothetical protein Mars2KO_02970 [Maribacter sp.]|uniref:hypothetical protein n=1 Tax=Maribacter sp. 2307UL18-2 TaxID=3386274 RepID=UPI0039BC6772